MYRRGRGTWRRERGTEVRRRARRSTPLKDRSAGQALRPHAHSCCKVFFRRLRFSLLVKTYWIASFLSPFFFQTRGTDSSGLSRNSSSPSATPRCSFVGTLVKRSHVGRGKASYATSDLQNCPRNGLERREGWKTRRDLASDRSSDREKLPLA